MQWFFVFFFVSGFCSILYEIVWLRLAMAQFGVTTALVSIVLSIFMAGLGLGSYACGVLLTRYQRRITFPPLRLYALTELLIGASALLVPLELAAQRRLISHLDLSSSFSYYLVCGLSVTLTLLPWCACMGATIPVAMLGIRNSFRAQSERSFSYLYLANVLGAVVGAVVPLFLIEWRGFHGTLHVGAVLNTLIAACAFAISFSAAARTHAGEPAAPAASAAGAPRAGSRTQLALLFGTGLTSMAIEVIWIRQFTPYLGTAVYAFALVLATYLAAMFLGSRIYRYWSRSRQREGRLVWVLLGISVLLPLITADPSVHIGRFALGDWLARWTGPQLGAAAYAFRWIARLLRLGLGIAPFSMLVGFITPMLVDRWSRGDPDQAGRAYAVNVVGCILGPLLAGFVLLPLISERGVLIAFSIPWLLVGLLSCGAPETAAAGFSARRLLPYALAAVAVLLALTTDSYEQQFAQRQVLRDNTATVVATGEDMQKHLLVNGFGMTVLTPLTKVMAHLSLSSLDHPPQSALVICFGMGTTFRSLLSWGIPVTAVELVPSVPKLFGYYHSDAERLLQSPNATIIVDDGRRFLDRTSQQFDVINIDPPPPVQAAGSSMLYSEEFYAAAKRRLRPGGILQQWLPTDVTEVDNAVIRSSVAKAVGNSFRYVRVFHSALDSGLLFLASDSPIPVRAAAELAQRLPPGATRDLMEWGPATTPEAELGLFLNNETTLAAVIQDDPAAQPLTDDRPVNEYYLMRRIKMSRARMRLAAAP